MVRSEDANRWVQVAVRFAGLDARHAVAAGRLMLWALIATGCMVSDGTAEQVSAEAEARSPDTTDESAEQVDHWTGALQIGNVKLNLRLDVRRKADDTLSAMLISIDQGNAEIPLDSIRLGDGKLAFSCQRLQAEYEGKLNEAADVAVGTFTQFGNKFDLELRLVEDLEALLPERPQMPKPPFPYTSEEVTFENKMAGVTLAGTLTIPDKAERELPAVVLVTGSGPQDRDETLMQHKPFLVIADHLSRDGIAVLRYDDRGVGKSGGDFASSTAKDFAQDASAALEFLALRDDIDPHRLGVIGHSEGGIIASMLAATNQRLAHVILLAGTGVPGSDVIISQAKAIADRSGQVDPHAELRKQVIQLVLRDASQEDIDKAVDEFFDPPGVERPPTDIPQIEAEEAAADADREAETRDEAEQQAQQMLRMAFRQMDAPWFRFFLKHDPRVDLRKAACPVLALNGTHDLQVLVDVNLTEIKKALSESPVKGHRCERLENLNHLFQKSETGLPQEYGQLTQTISPSVLEMITDWVKSR